MDTARFEGREEGLAQGREEGLEQGRAEGLEQGKLMERKALTQKLKEAGIDGDLIRTITGDAD